MNKSIIFYYPTTIVNDSNIGSGIRPYKMLNAFYEMGYEVDLVAGDQLSRYKKMKEVIQKVKNGKKYLFCYGENKNSPIVLYRNNLFLRPFYDFKFLSFLKENSVPIGLFYRDIHWNFNMKLDDNKIRRLVRKYLYKYNLYKIKNVIDFMFVPHHDMMKYIPIANKTFNIAELPPGCDNYKLTGKDFGKKLNLIYVGGIKPPIYNLGKLFGWTENSLDIMNLVVCCRQADWKIQKNIYKYNTDIDVVHLNHLELKEKYIESDVFILTWEVNDYLNFAMPIKLFEAISYELPIITTPGTAVSNYVLDNDIGWIVNSKNEFEELLSTINHDRNLISEKNNNVRKLKQKNLWTYRVETIHNLLIGENEQIKI